MAEHWFRMHANISDKPVAWRLAEAANIPLAKAIGHLAMFWGKISQYAPGGNITHIADAQLESWAGWDESRGVFAQWVRTTHATNGIVHEYDGYSGKLDERREKDRRRQAAWRQQSRRRHVSNTLDCHEDITHAITQPDIVTSSLANEVTRRDETRRSNYTHSQRAGELFGRFASEPQRRSLRRFLDSIPDFSGRSRDDLLTAWVSRLINWLDGEDFPGEKPALDVLATALGEYADVPGDYSPAHVKDFVLRSIRQARGTATPRVSGHITGTPVYAEAERIWKICKKSGIHHATKDTLDVELTKLLTAGDISAADTFRAMLNKLDLRFLREARSDHAAVTHIVERLAI